MSIVGEVNDRKERPAYVRFERRPVEDRDASVRQGKFVSKDVDYALVTPPYSRDVFEQVAPEWLAQMQKDSTSGRLPLAWYENYVESYERWKRGEEMPLTGTPIKGWAVLSPAQMKNLIALNILTVEDLASINDEGLRRIGMGAADLRDKAKAWLSQTKDKGPLTMENASLKAENAALLAQRGQLEARVKELSERLEVFQRGGLDRQQHFDPAPAPSDGISAADILEPPAPQPRGKKQAAAATI